jgi:hypothetical protein
VSTVVAAVVMMLAAHIAEPLTPAVRTHGNVSFGMAGVGLGSGCTLVKGIPVEDLNDPVSWSVDALFLSQARNEMFQRDDLLSDAGQSSASLARAMRVVPVVIPNTPKWRQLLHGDLSFWKTAVEGEFAKWRKRQSDDLQEV